METTTKTKSKKLDIILTKNIVALQKNMVCPIDHGQDNKMVVATLQSHLMQWGYMLDEKAFNGLSKSNVSFIQNFHDEVVEYLKVVMGGKHNYQPLYKNFPEEVISTSDFGLFLNTLIHYWSRGDWEPTEVVYERPIKFENIKYNMIGYSENFSKIFTDLVSINQSLTPQDLEIVKWFVTNDEKLVFPDQIPFKENLCTLAGMGIKGLPVKTTTDVLRIAVHLSGGDISLPKVPYAKVYINRWDREKCENPERLNFRFKKFSRSERKYILNLLENTNCDVKEMVLKDQRWIRLGEILHPSEYKSKFPKAANAFNVIRNEKIKSWYGQLNDAFKTSLENGLKVLSQRPGEFARRIDWLVRTYPKNLNLIMDYLTDALKNTSNKVLFEVYTHFEKRVNPVNNRSIMVKGSRKRTTLPNLPAIPIEVVENIHGRLFSTLKEKFSKLEPLGNCWIDEELKKIPLPTNMRSMNFSTKPSVRGQRIPFDNKDTKTIRPYLHFSKKNRDTTIDLSAILSGDGKNAIVDWTNLKLNDICAHSGDSWVRTGDCAEYVDINIEKALKAGFKYVLIQLHNYNQASDLNDGNYFGIMEREYPQSNKIWLPETTTKAHVIDNLKNKVNCAIIDLESREYIIVDEDAGGDGYVNISTISDFKQIESLINLPKISVYDLVYLHVEARGKLVSMGENVDTYFNFEDFTESYEKTGKLMGV